MARVERLIYEIKRDQQYSSDDTQVHVKVREELAEKQKRLIDLFATLRFGRGVATQEEGEEGEEERGHHNQLL